MVVLSQQENKIYVHAQNGVSH